MPKEIQDVLYGEDMMSTIDILAKKHTLHIDQLSSLESIISAVIRGRLTTKDFPENIARRLEIDRLKADAIAQDVSDMLFVKIRDAMKQVSEASQQQTHTPTQDTHETAAAEPTNTESLMPPPPPSTSVPTMSPATDAMLHTTTSVSAADPAKPTNYKTDPYREPIE